MGVPDNRAAQIPYRRVWSILFRTLHLLAISILFGGHVFNAPVEQLHPMLYLAVVSGIGMAALEAYPSAHSLLQSWGILMIIKLLLLCAVPFAWAHRVPILLVVLVIGSVGSHMNKRLRHSLPVFRGNRTSEQQ